MLLDGAGSAVVETFCIRQSIRRYLLIGNNALGNKVDDTTGPELV